MSGRWLIVGTVVLVMLGAGVLLYGLITSGSADPVASLEALQEERVIYLEEHHVFLVLDDGEPLALSDDAQHVGDRVEYCESSQMFESPAHNEKFDIRGYITTGGPRRADSIAIPFGSKARVCTSNWMS